MATASTAVLTEDDYALVKSVSELAAAKGESIITAMHAVAAEKNMDFDLVWNKTMSVYAELKRSRNA